MSRLKPFRASLILSIFTALALAANARTIQIQPADQAAIQLAIDQLPDSGGEIVITGITNPISIATSIVIDRDNVTLSGLGKIVLRLADSANAPVVIFGQRLAIPTATRTNIHLRNLIIDGNRLRQTSEFNAANPELRNNGISLRRVSDCSIEGVTTFGNRSGGLVTELTCRRILVKDFESSDNHFDGLACYETEDSTFTGMKLHDNRAAGISLDIDFVHNVISDSTLNDNHSVGIFMRDSRNNTFKSLKINRSGQHGIFVAQADQDIQTAVTGNKFLSCVITNSHGAGIRINDPSCLNNSISATQFLNNTGSDISEPTAGLLLPEILVAN
jgi:parallel beta-helix repeat protein